MVDVVYAVADDVTTLEPTQVSGFTDHTAALAIFGALAFNFDGRTGEVGYYPYLAEAIEPVASHAWRIRLRPGYRFHDGEPLDAAAVKFSFDRIRADGFPSNRYMRTAPIEAIEITGELECVIHTREPIAILPARLLRADGYVVAPDHYRDAPPWERTRATAFDPVGAGPFRFAGRRPGEALMLEVNRDFRDPRGYEAPNFDRLVLRRVGGEALAEQLREGAIDVATIGPELAKAIATMPGYSVVAAPDTSRLSFEINQTAHPALADRRVRQAINHAVDVAALCQRLAGGAGRRLATLVNPPNEAPDIAPYPYDPDRARRLLVEAGWDKGLRISIDWSTAADRGLAAEALVPYLEVVGIGVEAVRKLDWTREYQPRQVQGTLEALHCHGHAGVEMTVETDLWPIHPRRPANSTNWTGPEADRFVALYSELQSAVDADEQRRLGRKLQAIVHEEAVSLVLWQTPRLMAVSQRIAHFAPYPGGHNEDFWTIRMAGPA